MNSNKISKYIKRHLATILALTISLFTLMIYVRQANILTRQTDILIKQNKATTWPYLYINRGVSMDNDSVYAYNLNIANQGNGLAIIEKVVMRLDGVEIESWNELYAQMDIPKDIPFLQNNSSLRGRVIMPGENFTLNAWTNNTAVTTYMYSKFYNLELEICYRSVLNEYWTVKRSSFDEKRYYEDNVK